MNNYLELPNPPSGLLKCLKKLYKKTYAAHEFDITMSKFHTSIDLQEDEVNIIKKFIPVEIGVISWNRITDAGPPKPSHIDRGRKTALQIPVIANPAIHFSYVLKDEKYFSKLEPHTRGKQNGFIQKLETQWLNQRYPDMPMFHTFEEKYFDIMPIKPWVPYLNDTSVPHGGIHKGKQHRYRYFFSISLIPRKEIKDLREDFKDWL